jgi:hypothetical protein
MELHCGCDTECAEQYQLGPCCEDLEQDEASDCGWYGVEKGLDGDECDE